MTDAKPAMSDQEAVAHVLRAMNDERMAHIGQGIATERGSGMHMIAVGIVAAVRALCTSQSEGPQRGGYAAAQAHAGSQ